MNPTPALANSSLSQRSEHRHQIANRLHRAQGQLEAVIRAVEAEEPCEDVLNQLSAVLHAIERAGFKLVAEAMQDCVTGASGGGPDLDELERIFLRLA
ncbi:MAG: metal-sensitive transcriptional regulator [Solirubrobacteraceae bacterium]